MTRLKGAALGVAVGGAGTVPLGYALQELEAVLPVEVLEVTRARSLNENVQPVVADVTGIFIERVQEQLEEYAKDEPKKQNWKWFSRRN